MDIRVWMDGQDYEQDVRPLIKAFLPDAVFDFRHGTAADAEPGGYTENAAYAAGEKDGEPNYTLLFELSEHTILFSVMTAGKEIFRESVPFGEGERRDYRNTLLRLIYRGLSELTGTVLPWGILTGVRPTKLIYEKLDVMGEDRIREHMKREYYCSDEKTEVSLTAAKREKELMDELKPEEGYSLYIGIPFCPTTCLYCSFTSYPLEKFGNLVPDYLEALKKEIRFAAGCLGSNRPMSVYFGGGTPTTLSAEQLKDLIGFTKDAFDFTGVREFTVEAGRPDSLDFEKLCVLKEMGVDRISINPQSMCQETLDLIGRRHTVEQIEEAFRMARQAGHDNINMDLIVGLTGETPDHVRRTLARIRPLAPESLTVHTLAVKRAARLNLMRERYEGLAAVNVAEMLSLTSRFAKENGYSPYYLYRQKNMAENLENVGYSRRGLECLYNIVIMEERQTILALGAGASTKFYFPESNRLERVENVKSLRDYIGRVDEMIERKRAFLEQSAADGRKVHL